MADLMPLRDFEEDVPLANGPESKSELPRVKGEGPGRGNRRTGKSRGYRAQKGGAHTRAWREDPVIRERVTLVRRMMAEGTPRIEMLMPMNLIMKRHGEIEVGLATVDADIQRVKQEWTSEEDDSKDLLRQHIEGIRQVRREGWRAFRSTPANSMNKSGLLKVIHDSELSEAKLDGSLDSGRYAGTGEEVESGLSASDLLQAGKLQPKDYEVWLKVRAHLSGTEVPKIPELPAIPSSAQVIDMADVVLEGEVIDPLELPSEAQGLADFDGDEDNSEDD